MTSKEIALIVGAGRGLSASLTRLFASEDMDVAIAARNTDKLSALCEETGAQAYACDAVDSAQVDQLFASVTADIGKPDVVVTTRPIALVDRSKIGSRGCSHCDSSQLLRRVPCCPSSSKTNGTP